MLIDRGADVTAVLRSCTVVRQSLSGRSGCGEKKKQSFLFFAVDARTGRQQDKPQDLVCMILSTSTHTYHAYGMVPSVVPRLTLEYCIVLYCIVLYCITNKINRGTLRVRMETRGRQLLLHFHLLSKKFHKKLVTIVS